MLYESTSRPYRYLLSLSDYRDKRGKIFWWFVFHFLLFPRIPWDYWLFCIDSELPKTHPGEADKHAALFDWFALRSWAPPLLCIAAYFLAGSYFKAQFVTRADSTFDWLGLGGGAIWILFSITANLLTFLMIDVFALPYKESANELGYRLSKQITNLQNDLRRDINGVSEDILGHKLWARPETHQLFIGLSADKSGKRAKWFIVNFLSHLANDRIDIRKELVGDLYSISTGRNDWPISLYSKFLAKNMDHAESEILWLVDPDDFFGILLPEFVSYVLAAHVVSAFDRMPDIELDVDLEDPPSATSVFSVYERVPDGLHVDALAWQAVYQSVVTAIPSDIILQAKDPSHADDTWVTFHGSVLHPTVRFGAEIIRQSDLLPKERIVLGFERWTRKYLDGLLPHLMAFRNADSSVFRKRVVFLGCDMPKDPGSVERWIRSKISELWGKNESRWRESLKDVRRVDVIDAALDLFVYTCGGEDTLSIHGSSHGQQQPADAKTPLSHVAWDVGWYDRQFVVSAEETNELPPRRKVEWYYGAPPKDATEAKTQNSWRTMLPEEIHEALVLLDAARNGGGVSFAIFRRCLKDHLTELSEADDE